MTTRGKPRGIKPQKKIKTGMLAKWRNLANIAVKLINGYMNYLKKAGKGQTVKEDPAEYITEDHNHPNEPYPITNNQ